MRKADVQPGARVYMERAYAPGLVKRYEGTVTKLGRKGALVRFDQEVNGFRDQWKPNGTLHLVVEPEEAAPAEKDPVEMRKVEKELKTVTPKGSAPPPDPVPTPPSTPSIPPAPPPPPPSPSPSVPTVPTVPPAALAGTFGLETLKSFGVNPLEFWVALGEELTRDQKTRTAECDARVAECETQVQELEELLTAARKELAAAKQAAETERAQSARLETKMGGRKV